MVQARAALGTNTHGQQAIGDTRKSAILGPVGAAASAHSARPCPFEDIARGVCQAAGAVTHPVGPVRHAPAHEWP